MRRNAWLFAVMGMALGALLGPGVACQGEIDSPPGSGNGGAAPSSGFGGASASTGGGPSLGGNNVGIGGTPIGGPGGGVPSSGTGGTLTVVPDAGGGCSGGLTSCGGDCVNLQTDALHCGSCTGACSTGQICQAGACKCATGFSACGNTCVSVSSDPMNCGACGQACPAGQVCSNAACTTSCATGLTKCGLSCIDLTTNIQNCGACAMLCPAGQACAAGKCTCSAGLTSCANQCVNTMTSATNCGTCGTACGTGRSCTAGVCACPAGQTLCASACANTQTDPAHCGVCGMACATGGTCVAGKCNDPVPNVDSGPKTCRVEPNHMGGLTNYTPPTALPNCGIPYTVGAPDGLYAAMATADYNNYVSTNNFSGVCGMCAQITGPTGTVRVVHVIDQCPIGSNPLCTVGHIDLSVTAFQQLVPSNFGGMIANSPGVSWKYVACPVTGSITYHFKNGVNQFYAAVQVRNSKYGIASLKYRVAGSGGAFQNAVARTNDLAFFVINQANTLSFDFQVTDANGQVLGDNAISFSVDANTDPTSPGQDKPGHAQFPPCTP